MYSGGAERGRAAHPTHSLLESMWEEVIAGNHLLCAMSSSTAKFRNMKHVQFAEEKYAWQETAAVFLHLWLDTDLQVIPAY